VSNNAMSQAEYSRHRGSSRFAVTAWKRQGLLVFNSDGKIDVAASDALLDARPAVKKGGRANRRPEEIIPAEAAAEAAEAIAEAVADAPPKLVEAAALWTAAEAARRKEIALALLRQLEFDKASGAVVTIGSVRDTVEAEYSVLRDRFLQLPGRIAEIVVGLERPEAEEVIRAAVHEALSALSERAAL